MTRVFCVIGIHDQVEVEVEGEAADDTLNCGQRIYLNTVRPSWTCRCRYLNLLSATSHRCHRPGCQYPKRQVIAHPLMTDDGALDKVSWRLTHFPPNVSPPSSDKSTRGQEVGGNK